MLKKRIITTGILCCLVFLGCSGGSSSSSVSSEKKAVTWDYCIHTALNSVYGKEHLLFASKIKERTSGALNITVRGPGELPYKGTEFVRITSAGTIQMTAAPLGYITGEVKATVVPSWPMLASTAEDLEIALAAIMPIANKEMNPLGIQVIAAYGAPLQTFWGVGKPVRSLNDLKNKKIRTFDPQQQVMLNDFGAAPVSMVLSEVIPAMQRSVIETAITGAIYASDAKWYDIIKWSYLMPFCGSADLVLMNTKALENLSVDYKNIVLEEAKGLQARNTEYAKNETNNCIQNIANHGVEIIKPTAADVESFTTLASKYWVEWAQSGGPSVQEALEAVRNALKK
jgi:TRAP-type C4-dicarboxylate transport system substrate-binding protein